jgi:hypothetical protein
VHLLWPVFLGLILSLYVVMHLLEQSPRAKVDPGETDLVFFTSAFGFGTLTCVVIAWLLHWPFGWLARQGWPGLVPLAVLGAFLGLACLPEIALGSLVAFEVISPAPALVSWWVFPTVTGCSVHWLINTKRYGTWSEYALVRGVRGALIGAFVHHVHRPSLRDRSVRAGAWVAYTLPVLLSVAPSLFRAAAKPSWLGICGALLLSVNLWIWDWYLYVILRQYRSVLRISTALGVLAAVFLAISPAGAVVARLLAHVPVGFVGALAVIPLVRWLVTRRLRKYGRHLRGIALVTNSVVGPLTGIITMTITPLYLIALEHPRPHLLAEVTSVLAVVTVLNLLGAPILQLAARLSVEVKSLPRTGPRFCEQVVGNWVFDQFVTTFGQQNYRFVHMLAAQYAQTRQPELLDMARSALRIIEQEVFPFIADKPRAALQPHHDEATAECAAAQRSVAAG